MAVLVRDLKAWLAKLNDDDVVGVDPADPRCLIESKSYNAVEPVETKSFEVGEIFEELRTDVGV